jgi:hypothetical protein
MVARALRAAARWIGQASERKQIPVDGTHDVRDGELLRTPAQHVTPGLTPPALDQALAQELAQDGLQKAAGNRLRSGELAGRAMKARAFGQVEQRSERVSGAAGEQD